MTHTEERCHTYKFLSECFYIPDLDRIMLWHSFKDLAPGVYDAIAPYIPSSENLEEHVVDYSKLFMGPLNILAPPYGSIYLEGRHKLMGESTSDVINWYESEKLSLKINDVPDHIAFELEFMYVLALEELRAANDQNEELSIEYLNKQINFIEIHLGSWIDGFTKKMEEASGTEFYKRLAKLTRDFVTEDMLCLREEKIPQLN